MNLVDMEQKRKTPDIKEPETSLHEEKTDSKIDSETERKPAKLGDISRQNGTSQNRRAALEASKPTSNQRREVML
jgi:hypothetical protein